MEILVISAIFVGIVLSGAALAVTLVVRAVLADERYLAAVEQPASEPVPEPVWVEPSRAAA